MTRFIPTTIDETRFVIPAPRGRGADRAGECDNQASAPANTELASVRFRRILPLCPGQGLLSGHLAVAQPWRRERVFVLRFFGRLPGSGAMSTRRQASEKPKSPNNPHCMYPPIDRRSTPRTTLLRHFANSNSVSHLRRAVTDRGPTAARWLETASAATRSPLAFGLRLWVSVCLSLYVAFWLELDNPYWAGTTAALVCQPHLGASLRKGWYRMIGTIVGGIAIVILTACFPQDRIAFLAGLALWGAACALIATILRNFLALAAQIAGVTAAIIAGNELGATGGVNGEAFTLAVIRCTEICIGIVCAGVVLAVTDLGSANRRLATRIASIAIEIIRRFSGALARAFANAAGTTRASAACCRTRFEYRRGDRGIFSATSKLPGVTGGGGRFAQGAGRLAHRCGSLCPATA